MTTYRLTFDPPIYEASAPVVHRTLHRQRAEAEAVEYAQTVATREGVKVTLDRIDSDGSETWLGDFSS
jgi:hypothetical protein